MNPQLSKAIFGIGIALSVASVATVYVMMLATQNQNLNSQANPTSQQPAPTNSNTGINTSTTIAIPNGAVVGIYQIPNFVYSDYDISTRTLQYCYFSIALVLIKRDIIKVFLKSLRRKKENYV